MVLQLHQQHRLIVCIVLHRRFQDKQKTKKRNSSFTYESKQTVTIERFHTNDPVINICQQLYVPKTIQVVKIRFEDLKHCNQQLNFL